MSGKGFDDLRGASVFVTGGGSGIGAALVRGLLAQGARVAFVDLARSESGLEGALFLPCDVTDIASLHAAMEAAVTANGPLKALVNNAANDMRHVSADLTEAEWDAMQAINLKHYFFACQKAQGLMPESGGSIINFSSTSYMIGSVGLAPYTAANAGIVGMSRSLAREWGGRRIRVNSIAPGWVMTEKQKARWVTPEAFAAHLERQCLKEAMQPEDLLGAVLFLASDLSRMVTGQCLVVDAGLVVTG